MSSLNNVQTITLPEVVSWNGAIVLCSIWFALTLTAEFRDAQTVTASDLEEACLAIVHSVLFVRVIGPQTPREGHVQTLDVHYVSARAPAAGGVVPVRFGASHHAAQPHVSDAKVLQQTQDAVSRFCATFPARGHSVLCVRFFETVKKAGLWGFGGQSDDVLWEHWNIPMRLVRSATGSDAASLAASDEQRQRSARELRLCFEHVLVRLEAHLRLQAISVPNQFAFALWWCAEGGRRRRSLHTPFDNNQQCSLSIQ